MMLNDPKKVEETGRKVRRNLPEGPREGWRLSVTVFLKETGR
jgi:hypothetical protein